MEKQTGSLSIQPLIADGVAVPAVAAAAGAVTALTTDLTVDGSATPSAPETGWLEMGTSHAPDGQTLTVNNQYLVKDGKPWLPVMGEIHYSRVPPDQWDTELAKIKASGVKIVAMYVIWSHHEPQNGQFEWSEGKDLKKFVELCAKHGMYAFARIGPWTHGEVRYGGTPAWIVGQMPTRSDDPVYMEYVKRYYDQIGRQLQGQWWKDGGPVIGIQLENEYNLTGPLQGAGHIASLKKLALAAGLDVPLYTVTGWDNTVFPHREVTPVFGGYPDEPWGIDDKMHPPSETYAFRFTNRVGGNLGAQTTNPTAGDADKVVAHTPFLGAEYAGGLPAMYRRRPVVAPDDIGAMLPVQIGSGVNLYGYYMYHGGRNPPGELHLQESTASGGYNDLPTINYDFQAPFGANGEPHAVLGKIRPVHAFLDEWGQDLAPMRVSEPDVMPQSVADLKSPRFSLRSNGNSAFLFVNNYVRQYEMAPQKDVRFSVKLANETVRVPSAPITIPTGAYFIWPVEMDLQGVVLQYATAQPVTKVDTRDGPVFVFHEIKGISAEFSFAPEATIEHADSDLALSNVSEPSRVTLQPGAMVQVRSKAGAIARILMLSNDQAEKLSIVDVGGRRQLVLAEGQPFVEAGKLVLRTTSLSGFHFGLFPAPSHALTGSAPVEKVAAGQGDHPHFEWYSSAVPHSDLPVIAEPLRPAGTVPAVAMGGLANAAIEPYPGTFGKAAAWKIELPENPLAGLSNVYLSISYVGDIGRLFAGTSFIDDDFYNGLPWHIGLKQLPSVLSAPLTLTVLPLRDDARVYIDETYRPKASDGGQTAVLKEVKLIPEFELKTWGY